MEHLGPHRTFVDPHDTRGISKVSKSTPIPQRETPLEGTKGMLCPKDDVFMGRITHASIDEAPPPRAALVLGVLAVLCSAILLLFPWLAWLMQGVLDESKNRWNSSALWMAGQIVELLDQIGGLMFFVCFACVHLFGIFSNILSKGRIILGAWAIVGLYVGMFVDLALLHWFG